MLLGVAMICSSLKLLWYIPLRGYDTIYLSVLLVDIWAVSTSINKKPAHTDGHLHSFLLSSCREVELMAFAMGRILALVDIAKQFSKEFIPTYTPTCNV